MNIFYLAYFPIGVAFGVILALWTPLGRQTTEASDLGCVFILGLIAWPVVIVAAVVWSAGWALQWAQR